MSRARLVLLACLLVVAACRREERRPDRTEPWPAPALSLSGAANAAPAPARVRYTLARGELEFELPGRRASPRGRVGVLRGELDVDLVDPARSSGRVEADLESLELFANGTDEADPAYTERARSWLELGRGVPEVKRESGRQSVFSLRSLSAEGVPSPLENGRPKRFGVRGELALHGVRAPVATEVSVEARAGTSPALPHAELVIRSLRPLVVPLGTHQIKPRDSQGVLLSQEASLLGDNVGHEVRVRFELVFRPSS